MKFLVKRHSCHIIISYYEKKSNQTFSKIKTGFTGKMITPYNLLYYKAYRI